MTTFTNETTLRIPAKYAQHLVSATKDEEGYWIYCKAGYVFPSTGCQTAHEYTQKDILKAIREIEVDEEYEAPEHNVSRGTFCESCGDVLTEGYLHDIGGNTTCAIECMEKTIGESAVTEAFQHDELIETSFEQPSYINASNYEALKVYRVHDNVYLNRVLAERVKSVQDRITTGYVFLRFNAELENETPIHELSEFYATLEDLEDNHVKCSQCDEFMEEGFIVHDKKYCGDSCLEKNHTRESYQTMYEDECLDEFGEETGNGAVYWSEWHGSQY